MASVPADDASGHELGLEPHAREALGYFFGLCFDSAVDVPSDGTASPLGAFA